MKTYVKIFGPPLGDALDALQGIAVEMPDVSHYHMLSCYDGAPPYPMSIQCIERSLGEGKEDDEKAVHPAISRSGHTLGEHDFFFEWSEQPSWQQMHDLIAKIDQTFTKLGCRYTLTSK